MSGKTGTCEVPECGRVGVLLRGYCGMHYARWRDKGDPGPAAPARLHAPIGERLARFTSVAAPDACWEWTGSRNRHGYGTLSVSGGGRRTVVLAHRIAWQLANGQDVPDGLLVMHSCDNPPCVNPAHLSVGVQAENMRQAAERGRTRNGHSRRHVS